MHTDMNKLLMKIILLYIICKVLQPTIQLHDVVEHFCFYLDNFLLFIL